MMYGIQVVKLCYKLRFCGKSVRSLKDAYHAC